MSFVAHIFLHVFVTHHTSSGAGWEQDAASGNDTLFLNLGLKRKPTILLERKRKRKRKRRKGPLREKTVSLTQAGRPSESETEKTFSCTTIDVDAKIHQQ